MEIKKIAGLLKRRQKTLEKDAEQLASLLGTLYKKEDLPTTDPTADQIFEKAFSEENNKKYLSIYQRVMADVTKDASPLDALEFDEEDELE